MRVLLYDWNQNTSYYYKLDIRDTFDALNIKYDAFEFDFEKDDLDVLYGFFDKITKETYDFCFSINYFPEISNNCHRINLKYVSWGYDCPLNVVDIEKTLGNACNYVFCFDRVQCQGYRNKGFDTVYHLPLGVNVKRYKNINYAGKDKNKYKADISFVGSLYEGQYNPVAEICDSYTKGYLEGVISSQQQLYGAYVLNDVIDNNLIEAINKHFKELQSDTEFALSKEQLVHVIDQETSRRERIILLNLLGRRYDTHLYSFKGYKKLDGVHCHGTVDYYDEMPYLFNESRINLNMTVKGIQTGVPLRAMDIMASGGFLLSNYQVELMEYFEYEKHMVVYESMADAVAKCEYYLNHEDIRKSIATNAQENIFLNHSMVDRMKLILETAGLSA